MRLDFIFQANLVARWSVDAFSTTMNGYRMQIPQYTCIFLVFSIKLRLNHFISGMPVEINRELRVLSMCLILLDLNVTLRLIFEWYNSNSNNILLESNDLNLIWHFYPWMFLHNWQWVIYLNMGASVWIYISYNGSLIWTCCDFSVTDNSESLIWTCECLSSWQWTVAYLNIGSSAVYSWQWVAYLNLEMF